MEIKDIFEIIYLGSTRVLHQLLRPKALKLNLCKQELQRAFS